MCSVQPSGSPASVSGASRLYVARVDQVSTHILLLLWVHKGGTKVGLLGSLFLVRHGVYIPTFILRNGGDSDLLLFPCIAVLGR